MASLLDIKDKIPFSFFPTTKYEQDNTKFMANIPVQRIMLLA
jgi:hypothetical protein